MRKQQIKKFLTKYQEEPYEKFYKKKVFLDWPYKLRIVKTDYKIEYWKKKLIRKIKGRVYTTNHKEFKVWLVFEVDNKNRQ